MSFPYGYMITPLLAWLICGGTKFLVNSLRERRLAFDLIGYGGMPSNHAAISSSIVFLIGLTEGVNTPAFGLGVAFVFIVVLDASSLRRQVGRHAEAINRLDGNAGLRERMGHSRAELAAGIGVGLLTALFVDFMSELFF